MSHIRSKNTRPEWIVRRFLHAQGYRFRLHVKQLPGTPDIVLRRLGICIFVNGCFWHGHMIRTNEGATPCRYFVIPKTHIDFWENKIKRNQQRDAEQREKLKTLGWQVIDIWECELKAPKREKTLHHLLGLVQKRDINHLRYTLQKTYQEYTDEDLAVAEDLL